MNQPRLHAYPKRFCLLDDDASARVVLHSLHGIVSANCAQSPRLAYPAVAFIHRSRCPMTNVVAIKPRERTLRLLLCFGSIFKEAKVPSSACRLWRVSMVETSTPPEIRKIEISLISADGQGGRGVHLWRGTKMQVLRQERLTFKLS